MRAMRLALLALLAGLFALAASGPAAAEGPNAVRPDPGCNANALSANDDGSTPPVEIGFVINFFGMGTNQLFVNNNGNVTLGGPMSTFTPFGLTGATGTAIIAPFFADVDTRGSGSGVVRYSWGGTTIDGRAAFCVNWINVGYYSHGVDKLNSFQLVLVDRSDVGAGDFDIEFNYDKVLWETGSASGGSGGLGGISAGVGFSAGSGVPGTFFEMPGSRQPGSFLDSNLLTGLIHGSRNTLQQGRYLFPVRNGLAPVGGAISGTVRDGEGNALAGAPVQVCPVGGGLCAFVTTTNGAGQYNASGLPPADYTVTAYPPPGVSLSPDTEGPLTVTTGASLVQDLVLTGPVPPPAGTSIDDDTPPGAIPSVVVGRPVHLETTGCDGGAATYTVTGNYGSSISGPMTEGPAGTYTADFEIPFTGPATVTIVIEGCPAIEFNIYIDPSGFVRTTTGAPVVGATVTLYRSDSPTGPFAQVADGSAIMSPANRTNPDATDATGHFGWDVIAGYYLVRAQAADCHAPGDPDRTYVETEVLTIPPPVTDLLLVLECAGDTVPPVLDVPAGVVAEAESADGAVVGYAVTATDDTDPAPVVACEPASGATFPIGTTTVECTATDASGNVAHASFDVVVQDTTAPAVSCDQGVNPSGKTASPSSGFRQGNASDAVGVASLAFVSGTFSSSPLAPGSYVKLTQAPGSGGEQQPGEGVLAAKLVGPSDWAVVATDAAGNSASASCGDLPPRDR